MSGFSGLGGLVLIERFAFTGAESAKVFSAIPQTFSHLRLILDGRSQVNGLAATVRVRPNNDDTAGNFIAQYYSISDTTVSGGYNAADQGFALFLPGATAVPASTPGTNIMDIINYRSALHKRAAWRIHYRFADTGAGTATYVLNGTWESTDPITSLQVIDPAPNLLVAGSTAWLYGMP